MTRARIPPHTKLWYNNYLTHRTAVACLRGCSTKVLLKKGTPQGGVLSPVLWNITFDDLLLLYDQGPVKALGYADDGSLMACGRDPVILMQLLKDALNKALAWGHENGLTFAANKTEVVIFTTKYKVEHFPKLTMGGIDLEFSTTCLLYTSPSPRDRG